MPAQLLKVKLGIDSPSVTLSNASSNTKTFITADTSNTLAIQGNVKLAAGLYANNSLGSSGQVLTTSGSGVYWSTITGGSGGGSVTISGTAPTSPSAGDLWFSSEEGTLSIYYTDVDSSQWVVVSGPAGADGANGINGVDGADGITMGKAIAAAIVFG